MSEDKKTRKLTSAQLRRRRRRNLQRFGNAGSSSHVERQCPADIDPKLLEFAVGETRYLLRSGVKGIYGANIAKEAERIFSKLRADHRQFFIDFVNWLVRNKVELASGRYSSRNTQKSIAAVLSAAKGNQPITSAVPAVCKPRIEASASAGCDEDFQHRTSASPNAAENTPLEPSGGTSRDRPAANKTLSAEPTHPTNGRVSTVDEGAKRGSPEDIPDARSPLQDKDEPRIPGPFDFKYKREGERLANAFFGSILYNPELENIKAKARALADDVDAVRAVQERGQTERDYLKAAMADLGIKLP